VVNLEKAKRILKYNILPPNSAIRMVILHESIISEPVYDQVISEDFVNKIKLICSGSVVKNPIQDLVDFSSNEEISKYFFKNSEFTIESLDINSSLARVKTELNIRYVNRKDINFKFLDDMEEIEFITFFGRYEI